MKNVKTGLNYFLAYAMWVVVMALGILFILLGRETLLDTLAVIYVESNFQQNMQAGFLEKAYYIIVGLLWIVLMIISEEQFRRGVARGDLLRQISRITGPELLLLFLVDFFRLYLQSFAFGGWLHPVILVGELVIGAFMVWYGWRPVPKKVPVNTGV